MGPRVVVVGHTGFLWGLFVFVYVVMETREVGMATPESMKHMHLAMTLSLLIHVKSKARHPGPVSFAGLWRMVAL